MKGYEKHLIIRLGVNAENNDEAEIKLGELTKELQDYLDKFNHPVGIAGVIQYFTLFPFNQNDHP